MTRVSIIGTVGVPANYGGFEILAENLARNLDQDQDEISLSIYCSSKNYETRSTRFAGASLRYLDLHANGVQSVFYDVISLVHAYLKRDDVVLLLGVSGALFLPVFRFLSSARVITNIDGIEWKRKKWGVLARSFLRLSERFAIRFSDHVIADNQAITDYVSETYSVESTTIAYGGDHAVAYGPGDISDLNLPEEFSLGLCRIEPENNVAMILHAFHEMPERHLVFVGNWDQSAYGRRLRQEFDGTENIHMIDPVFELSRLRAIRDRATHYVHGHSAGGTNPSLVEMMHFGIPVLAYDCSFNRHSTGNHAAYFDHYENLISLRQDTSVNNGTEMQSIARKCYTWNIVARRYFDLIRIAGESTRSSSRWPGRVATLFLLGVIAFAMSACGAIYITPSVKEGETDFAVQTIPMTFESVSRANKSLYTPAQIPSAFFEFVPPAPFSPTVSQVPLPQSPGVQNGPTLLKRPPKVEPQPYQIGVGDVLNVVSDVDVSELTRPAQEVLRLQSGYRVGNDGTIVVPSIGSVEVAGLTRSAAQKALFERLLSQGSDPGFSLNIQEFNSQSVSIGGDVGQPGRIAIKLSPLRLHEALAQSAGIRLRDDRQAVITIYRDREIFSIPVPEYKSNPSLQEILLVDGDAIFIEQNYDIERALAFFERQVQLTSVQNEERNGEMARLTQLLSHRRNAIDEQRRAFDMRHTLDAVPRDYVYLAGELEAQARFTLPYERHASLADALFSKGGFNVPFSDPSEIYLLRIDRKSNQKNSVLAFHLDSENAARLVLATELQLRPNDVIFIEEQPIAKWERALRSVFNIGLGPAARIVN